MGKILTYRKENMLVFFVILIIIFLISGLVYYSTIRLEIIDLKIEKNNKFKLENLNIKIYLSFMDKIKYLKLTLDNKTIEKINKDKLEEALKKAIKLKPKLSYKDLKSMVNTLRDVKFEKMILYADVGWDSVITLSYFVASLDILISILLAKHANNKKDNYKYSITPYQTEKFRLKLSINCIISLKIADIINMIIKKRSEEKNARTSYRIINGNCNE